MTEPVGIIWNPSKISEKELRAAWEAATEELAGTSGQEDLPEALWFSTSEDDPGASATQEALAAGCGLIIAAGGDGTVRAVAAELGAGKRVDQGAELGILPRGTGNLLARNLDVPLNDPAAALVRALSERARPIDLCELELERADGSTETQAFVVMAGFGIDAQMIVETDDELKSRAGWLAYVESLGRAVAGSDVTDFTITLGDDDPVHDRAHTVLIGNCGTLQGGVTLLPDAEPDDGKLDLLLLRADGVVSWMETLRNVVWDNGVKRLISGADRAESTESTEHAQAERVSLRLDQPLELEVDGDEVGEVVAFTVVVRPGALRVR